MIVTTAVDAARNANNKVVGQKIGRDNYKINNLEWPYLDAETWSSMLQEFDKHFFSSVQFWDMVNNCWRTLTMYPGDRSADVFKYDKNGIPIAYINCKVNITLNSRATSCHVADCKIDGYDCKTTENKIIQQ